ncbi:hypothetical protein GCWU000282_00404 [Catonella morbi ATCC 51271]|uniref:Uncharacterized protein n=2 Tax=Catonella TaxID=43996 RepID=V2Y519_9FIRM|nr:hypothetical protein GCWU000282_00404 [Catonella morbi ATCC 51271]
MGGMKMGFVNDYLTVEEQEMFEKRAIPMGVWWQGKGAILGCDLPNKVRCTIDRENHVYLFNLGKDHSTYDLDVENFKMVWDYLGKNKGIAFTMKREFVGEYKFGIGNDIVWNNFNLYLSDELYPKREIIVDKIKEAMRTYGTGGGVGTKPKYKIEFDF